jgi:hypothetical protein
MELFNVGCALLERLRLTDALYDRSIEICILEIISLFPMLSPSVT